MAGAPPLQLEDLVASVARINYGMGDRNPVDHVHFYRRKSRSHVAGTPATPAKPKAAAAQQQPQQQQQQQGEAGAAGFKIHSSRVSCLVLHYRYEQMGSDRALHTHAVA